MCDITQVEINTHSIHVMFYVPHCNPRIVMMPTLSSMEAPEDVKTTASYATIHDEVGIMSILSFRVVLLYTIL